MSGSLKKEVTVVKPKSADNYVGRPKTITFNFEKSKIPIND